MAENCNIAVSKPQTTQINLTGKRAALIGTSGHSYCWNGVGRPIITGNIHPFRLNVIGNLTTQYDSDGNLWAILTDAKAVPSAANSTRYTGVTRAPWYGSISSNIAAWRAVAIACVVTFNDATPTPPPENSPAWHKCLGQWYAAGVTCGGNCQTGYGNPPGGTNYIWNDYNNPGTTPGFSKAPDQNGTRAIPEQRWNLGKIRYGNGLRPKVWVIVQPQQAVGNSNPNCNLGFRAQSMVAGASVDVQTLTICPPELTQLEESNNICKTCVNEKLYFGANDLGGLSDVTLEIEYKYKGQSWNNPFRKSMVAQPNVVPDPIELDCLLPSQEYEWRARYIIGGDYDAESEYVYGSFTTRFIPTADMSVPDITDGDCTTIKKGGLLDEFTEPTCYNDVACVTAKIPANYCDTMEQEMADYEDPGCRDKESA